ncbi:MAG: ferritin [bacterium]
MITKKLVALLEAQIGHELHASHYYLGIAAYFADKNLDKWAGFFYRQSAEERVHALKIVKFLIDVEATFRIPAVAECATNYKSAVDAAKAALASEQRVTKQFHAMADAALAEKDYTSFQFVQWFIGEQVEEEATMQKLVDVFETGIDLLESEEHVPTTGE